MVNKIWQGTLFLLVIPLVVILGVVLFQDKQYAWISLCIAILSCLPFFVNFETGKSGTKHMLVIAVMIALSVVGRILFTPIPGFKPVTAIVVITAMYFGSEAGFVTGALSAVISNFYFGQGPWTPFQMFVWGLIGLLAGLMANSLKRNKWLLAGYGLFAGVLFSLLMDVWTVLWWDGSFQVARYAAAIVSALGFTATYAVSNIVFLLLLGKPIGQKLERIKDKYAL